MQRSGLLGALCRGRPAQGLPQGAVAAEGLPQGWGIRLLGSLLTGLCAGGLAAAAAAVQLRIRAGEGERERVMGSLPVTPKPTLCPAHHCLQP